jgi:GH15 family glucan-1,4-alpha-glucosidase
VVGRSGPLINDLEGGDLPALRRYRRRAADVAVGASRRQTRDYRYCWLRDATFTLLALMNAAFDEDARALPEWVLRTTAGEPERLQIMYGLTGEHRVPQ